MDMTLRSALEDVGESLIESYELAMAYGGEDDKKSSEYSDIFTEMLITKNKANHCVQALDKAKVECTLEDLEREYESTLKSLEKNYQPKRTKEFKDFIARLEHIKDSFANKDSQSEEPTSSRVECDEMVIEDHIQIIDPLTKKKMENPVKNQLCGHRYDKSSILEAMKINKRLRCPVVGCGNKTFVQNTHLIEDDAFKIKIMNMNTEDSDDSDE